MTEPLGEPTDELRRKVEAVAGELLGLRDWLTNGHRASDYGHDLMIALGDPDLWSEPHEPDLAGEGR